MQHTCIILTLIVLIPLIGGSVAFFSKSRAGWLASGSIALSLLLVAFLDSSEVWLHRFEWLPGFSLGWRLDRMALVLMALVLFVSLMVHVFSIKYMHREEHPRYFAKLAFFTSSMLGLLLADHLILLFIFWELVGFSSYLLIGFYYTKQESAVSAKWAFMTNRLADAALLAGLLALGSNQSFFLSEMTTIGSLLIGCGLIIGAMGKSAQFPFSAWLPRAMTGPTPVSALIHAATMVAAGVYLLLRVGPYLPVELLNAVAIIGGITAFFGAFTAVTQHDIKLVLAYSTVSQLGFMFLGIGTGAFESAFFHLWTHAFFKAGLFLVAGIVIHHLGTQDMRKMGGLSGSMKWVMRLHIICGLGLAGVPLFTGYMSKEGILQSVWHWAEIQTSLGYSQAHIVSYFSFLTVFLTAWYVGRQWWLMYFTPKRSDEEIKSLQFDWKMGVPVSILALLSIWVFHFWNPFATTGWVSSWVGYSASQHAFGFIPYLSAGLAMIGLLHCYGQYGPRRFYVRHYAEFIHPSSFVGKFSYFGWYLDGTYKAVIGPFYLRLAKGINWVDKRIDGGVNLAGVLAVVFAKVIHAFDRFVIDGCVWVIYSVLKWAGSLVAKWQSPQIQQQIFWLIISVIGILLMILFL
jgi:NADH-quinone oxidoreductase subunit L